MNHDWLHTDTICAPATAAGGAIGVIRISGSQTFNILQRLLSCEITEWQANTAHYTIIRNGEEIVDEVVVTVFHAPHSYTGEDSAEISCHGSRYIMNKVLELLVSQGCRMANPGEYTQRAFMNGKMDLSQAEAVADLIASSNSASHKVAMSQLRGHFSSELSVLRDQLLHLTSLLELELDFSDHEDLEFADRTELKTLAYRIQERITTLSHSFKTGKAIKDGVPVAIIGKTNVGKSTLLNRLLHDDKAIVSDIHGTTRDVIEDTTVINGVTFRFIDTAGIRDTSDTIEQMGIERTYATIDKAKVILWLIDEKPSETEMAEIQTRSQDKALIIVRNKIDKDDTPFTENKEQKTVYISAKYDIGIDVLENEIFQAADIPEITENDVIVTNIRHFEALQLATTDIQRVIDGLEGNVSGDLLSEDLRSCIHHLADIVGGEITPTETLSTIFERFCVGK